MSNRIYMLRKEFGLKQKDIAAIFDTTSTNIGNYEVERRDMSTEILIKFCDYFQVTIDYLLNRSDNGVIVYNALNDERMIISESLFFLIKEKNCLIYNGMKRVVDFKKLFENDLDLNYLLSLVNNNVDYIVSLKDLNISSIVLALRDMDNEKTDVVLKLVNLLK